MHFFKSRIFRQGSVATILTLAAIVLLVLVNLLASTLSSRYALRIDMTGNNIFTLSEESKSLLAAVTQDVTVYVLSPEEDFASSGLYFQQAAEVMRGYARENPHIAIEYVDLIKNPGFVSRYPDLSLEQGGLVVDSNGKAVALSPADLFNTQRDPSTYQTVVTSSRTEQALASAILTLTSQETVLLSLLEGHNESSPGAFLDLLKMNNFTVITQNLMTQSIDPKAHIALMNAPTRAITEEEARKLGVFLENGGAGGKTFFYLASAQTQPEMPVLSAFLAEWGIEVLPGVVFETDQNRLFQLNPFMTLAGYAESVYAKDVMSKDLPFAMPASRPLRLLFDEKTDRATEKLLAFAKSAGVMPQNAPTTWQPGDTPPSGPLLCMGMSQQTRYEGAVPRRSTVLVAGAQTALEAEFLKSPNMANAQYLLNLLGALAGLKKSVFIKDKAVTAPELGITAAQAVVIGSLSFVILPLVVLIIGIAVWAKRRHL